MFYQWHYTCNYYILCIKVLSTYTVLIAIKWLIYDYINQYIFISIYSTERNKNKIKAKTKKHRKSAKNACLLKTQSHTIPEVLSSFGNSTYNIKKMKYKERPVLHAYTDGVPYTKSNWPNFDNLSDTENIRMLTDI